MDARQAGGWEFRVSFDVVARWDAGIPGRALALLVVPTDRPAFALLGFRVPKQLSGAACAGPSSPTGIGLRGSGGHEIQMLKLRLCVWVASGLAAPPLCPSGSLPCDSMVALAPCAVGIVCVLLCSGDGQGGFGPQEQASEERFRLY